MKAGSGVKVEDGPGAALVSKLLCKLKTDTPVTVSMRYKKYSNIYYMTVYFLYKVKWYHEVDPLVFT